MNRKIPRNKSDGCLWVLILIPSMKGKQLFISNKKEGESPEIK